MTTLSENPLYHLPFEIPFDAIKAEHVKPAVNALLKEATAALERIAKEPGQRTYDNTMGALEAANEQLERTMGIVGHLESVASSDALREAYNGVQPDVSAFYASIPLRADLWQALKSYSQTQDAKSLTGPRARLLGKTLSEFRRSGAELGDKDKARLEAISRELAELTSKFSQNVLDETADFELIIDDEAQLAGLPQSALDAAKADAKSKGKEGFRFTLNAPSLIPLLTYLDDREIRRQVWSAYNTRASRGERDNGPIIEKVLRLRAEQATLLGYDNFGDLVLEDRMAGNAKRAKDFVRDLAERTTPFFKDETDALLRFRRDLDPGAESELQAWDVAYYSEKERKALYDFDEEALRPYFAIDGVMAGLFEIANRLYQVSIKENNTLPTWHKSVKVYDIIDAEGIHLASFYSDIYPREEKRGGAWMNAFITGGPNATGFSPHLGLICANVTPPLDGKPALLTHREVETMFHEFGHLLHHCLSRVEVRSLSGTNVAWDFVELPSQIMENWCWEREALDSFARHTETGETIPSELFEKMVRARTYREASATMRQLGFASTDLQLHVSYRPDHDGPVLAYARSKMAPFATAPFPEDYAMLASFTHLFASAVGYAAGYYSYKWAEVLDADAFTRFKKEGIFNETVGREFLNRLLSQGDTKEPAELYTDFMGREPSLDALMERSGLKRAS